MAFIRKIKASLVRLDVEDYVGEETYLFYDIETGCLRQYDGTPGGKPACIEGISSGGISTVQDEGIEVSAAATLLNFAGAGVTVTEPGAAGEMLVTIPGGGGGSAIEVQDEGISLTADVSLFNFAGTGVTVTEPVADQVLVTIPDTSVPGLTITTINGQPMLTLEDTTRADKILSVGEQEITWTDNKVSNNDWLRIGHAKDAISGYVMDFDGTIVYATAHCKDVNNNDKEIRIYIDGVDSGSVGTLSGDNEQEVTNATLNLDFTQGQKLRLRAIDGVDGDIKDLVVKLTTKWRG